MIPANDQDIIHLAGDVWAHAPEIYLQLAAKAVRLGWWWAIPGRESSDVYLVRFWVLEPQVAPSRELIPFDRSICLHWIVRPDDDRALHNHPCPFSTQILDGAYLEYLPPLDWDPKSELGPPWKQRAEWRRKGDIVHHEARSLHLIAHVEPNTWTCVRTGPKEQAWGFHPPGMPFMQAREYFAWKRQQGVPA